MRYFFSIIMVLLVISVAHAELMVVDMKIVKTKADGWTYVVSEGQKKELATDEELAEFFKKLSNPRDGIWLTIQSETDVPIEQIMKILAMVKANAQGIVLKRIVLDSKRLDRAK